MRQPMPSFCRLALSLLVLLAIPLGLPAQSAPAASSGQAAPQQGSSALPTLRVTTRLVIVDVVATDRKGAAVNDLKAEDFSIQEDGAPQTIKVFNLPQASQSEASPESVKLPANMVSNVPTFRSNQALSVVL